VFEKYGGILSTDNKLSIVPILFHSDGVGDCNSVNIVETLLMYQWAACHSNISII